MAYRSNVVIYEEQMVNNANGKRANVVAAAPKKEKG